MADCVQCTPVHFALYTRPKRIDFFKPTTSSQPEEFDPATSVTLKMVLAQDEADAGSVTFIYCKKNIV